MVNWYYIITAVGAVAVTYVFMFGRFGRRKRTPKVPVQSDGTDVVIVGAGVAGCAMAYALAKDGRNVVVIERDLSEPDRIVGELLQPGGLRSLRKIGLGDCVNGIDASIVHGYCVHYKGKKVTLPYPYTNKEGSEFVWVDKDADNNIMMEMKQETGRSFHHGEFIMNLRNAIMKHPKITVIEGTVLELIEEKDLGVTGVIFRDRTSDDVLKEVKAPLTFVIDGCFSKFRKTLSTAKPVAKSHFVGVIMKDAELSEQGKADVVLTPHSIVLAYQLSTRDTRVLIDIPGSLPSAGNGDLKEYVVEKIAPHVPEKWRPMLIDGVNNDRLRSMPNSMLPAAPIRKRGVVLLGDALNMRHPLTGGGMSVAFGDVLLWRDYLRTIPDLNDNKAILECLDDFHWSRKSSYAFVVNVLAQALYALFSAADENLEVLRQACFNYFEFGGECAGGPVRLLSILTPKPFLLIYHFFMVAFVGMKNILFSSSLLSLPFAPFKAIIVLYAACKVIFPLIYAELRRVSN
eukprot:Nk52_evm78s223 gene=Nk52_evmTU78s223